MIYRGKFSVTKEKLEYYNTLLDLDLESEDEEYLEEIGARKDDQKGIVCIEFDNDYYLTIDLCSGTSNYYDNVVLFDADGNEECVLDCEYEIGSLEFEHEGNTYIVEMEIEENGRNDK